MILEEARKIEAKRRQEEAARQRAAAPGAVFCGALGIAHDAYQVCKRRIQVRRAQGCSAAAQHLQLWAAGLARRCVFIVAADTPIPPWLAPQQRRRRRQQQQQTAAQQPPGRRRQWWRWSLRR